MSGERTDPPEFSYSTSEDGAQVVREIDGDYIAGIGAMIAMGSALGILVIVGWLVVAAIVWGAGDLSLLVAVIPLGLGVVGGVRGYLGTSPGVPYDLERIMVSPAALVHSRSHQGKNSKRTFDAQEINTLRWERDQYADNPTDQTRSGVEFYYGAQTVHIFPGIKQLEAKKVMATITDQIPSAALPFEAWRAAREATR